MELSTYELARRAFLRDVDADTVVTPRSPLAPASRLIELGKGDAPYIGEAVCTIGAFDGIHRGHRFLFSRTVLDARRRGLPSVIMTFDPDPDELFLPFSKIFKLLNNEDRLSYLTNFGADFVLSVPFTRSLAAKSAESFLRDVVTPVFKPRAIHVGSDFKLGAGNAGNVDELRKLGTRRSAKCEVFGYDLVCNVSEPVTATRVRRLLIDEGNCAAASQLLCRSHFVRGTVEKGRQKGREFGFPTANVRIDYPLLIDEGNCAAASQLLCRSHFVRGTVEKGRQKGREFGFPTANVRIDYPYVVPAEGVYAGLVLVDDVDTVWPAAVNVGVPRTFADEENCASIEAHMLGFEGDLYGREVSVAFVERLRGQQAFASIDELMATVNSNIAWTAEHLGSEGFRL